MVERHLLDVPLGPGEVPDVFDYLLSAEAARRMKISEALKEIPRENSRGLREQIGKAVNRYNNGKRTKRS
jgi:hypothetical protein